MSYVEENRDAVSEVSILSTQKIYSIINDRLFLSGIITSDIKYSIHNTHYDKMAYANHYIVGGYMELTIEFAGLSRVLTHQSKTTLQVAPDTTFRQLLSALSDQYPELVGEVIHKDRKNLQSSNMLNVNGKHMVQPAEMDMSPSDGDRVILMSILAGG